MWHLMGVMYCGKVGIWLDEIAVSAMTVGERLTI